MPSDKSYPDLTELLAQKARGRQARAKLSFAEKLEALERLKEAATPFVRAREARKLSARKPTA